MGSSETPVLSEEPLLDLSKKIGPIVGLVTTAASVAAGLGALNTQPAGIFGRKLTAARIILTLLPAVLAGVSGPLASYVTAAQGRQVVSPVLTSSLYR